MPPSREVLIDLQKISRRHVIGDGVVNSLDGVSLTVRDGEYLAITGPSGCGKSSLLNVLGLLDRPDAGTHFFSGCDVRALDVRGLARLRAENIGFVFQQFHLLPHVNARDNVALPLRYANFSASEVKRRANEALAAVDLSDRAEHLPRQLSGGQCQRVAIARALVRRPHLLLADEPTGALDSSSGERIMELMLALHRSHGMTLILVTHDTALAQTVPRCVRLKDGRVASDDMVESLCV